MTDDTIFTLGNIAVSTIDLVSLISIFIFLGLIFIGINRFGLPVLLRRTEISPDRVTKGKILLFLFLLFLYFDLCLIILDIDAAIYDRIGLAILVESGILLILTYVVLWVGSNVYIHNYFARQEKNITESQKAIVEKNEKSAINTLKWLLFAVAILILFRYINWDYTLWEIKSPKENAPAILIRLSSIISTITIFLITRLAIWVITQWILHRYYRRQQFDAGISYSINKLVAYLAYFIATIVALRNLGMDIGLLLGGAAALLVGIGLALQSTFSDFFAGLVLLFERPIKVGDYIGFEGKPVEVQKIGLRASIVKSRDNINFIIPNSKMITQPVINWSHDEKSVRFLVTVGVAYGSDTKLVEELLMKAASEHKEVMKRPKPKVVFSDFGESSLQFNLFYYSTNIYNAEWVKSDLRFAIDKLFRDHKIIIPFPQRDVWMKS